LHWPAPRAQFRSILAGARHRYAVNLKAGQYARVVVEQRDIDLGISVSGPGLELPEINGSDYGSEAVTILARAPGAYVVQVIASKNDSARGAYRIALTEVRQARPPDEAALRAHFAFSRAEATAESSPTARAEKERLLLEAIQEWHIAHDQFHEAQALNLAGRLVNRQARYLDAQQKYQAALVLWNQLGDRAGRLETSKLYANLGGFLGEDRASRQVLEQYLAEWQIVGDRRAEANLISSVGASLLNQNAFRLNERAFRRSVLYEERALRLREALGNRRATADSLETLASRYVYLGDYHEALRYAERSVQVSRELGNRRSIASAVSSLAAVLERLGRHDEAARLLEEALAIHQEAGDVLAQVTTRVALSYAEAGRGHLEKSLDQAARSIEMSERLSAQRPTTVSNWASHGFGGMQTAYVSALQRLHWREPAAGYQEQAFLAADRARGRYISDTSRVGFEEVRASLDSDTALLEFVTFGPNGVVWTIDHDGICSYRLPDMTAIRALAFRVFDLLNDRRSPELNTSNGLPVVNPSEAEFRTVSTRLSQLLLGPAASALKARRILIVGEESLSFLPFAALPDPTAAEYAPLIAHHELIHLSSATAALAARKRRRREPERLLAVVADPVFDSQDRRLKFPSSQAPVEADLVKATRAIGLTRDGGGIPRLPFARQEADNISSMAPSRSTVLLGFDASRQQVLPILDRYRVLHFTTHGIANSAEPELSGLVLSLVDSRGQPREGFLRLSDIYDRRISADLVAMSACQTARGRDSTSFGVVGLTGAFLHAGAARVLATLWTVDDEATAVLMSAFYRGLLSEHLSPAAALRQAQLSIAEIPRWHSPYYWAGVLLYGDWRPMWKLD
jgi:CHAT domain-containing protein/tetratricopeptide (TPR) repeat protein